MADHGVEYILDGEITDSLVFYSGHSFCIRFRAPSKLSMAVYGENGTVCRVFADSNNELHFPENEEGTYWFDVFDGENKIYSDRIIYVNNIYRPIKLPMGSIYHIFVDRFARHGDIECKEDAVINFDWDNGIPQYASHEGEYLKNNEFFGGNLYGITDKLDYIRSLGTEWIYLSPIFTAYSNHKYDTGDFMSVDSMFGSRKALDKLIEQAHKNGMKIILDGVFNHVGRDSVYFDYQNRCGGAYQNPDSPYRKWFSINPDGSYDCWWGLTNLPKIVKTRSFRDFICKKVIPEYMKAGIDGWRLDVVDEYDNSFLAEITAAAKQYNPDAVIIGEVWDDVTDKVAYGERKKYFCGKYLDSAMNYPVKNAVIQYIKTNDAAELKSVIEHQIKYYPKEKLLSMMNFLGTHDTERILTVLGDGFSNGMAGEELANRHLSCEQLSKAKRMLKAAYALLVCLPGIPSVYYGDEAGAEGYRDPFNRRPFPWKNADTELTEQIASLNLLRKEHEALVYGSTEIVQCNNGFFVFTRTYKNKRIYCICNFSEKYDYFVNSKLKPLNKSPMVLDVAETGIYLEETE